MTEKLTVFEDSLTISISAAVTCQVIDSMPDTNILAQENLQTLTLLASLEELIATDNFEDAHEYGVEWTHINQKVSVLLSLVSELLMRDCQHLTFSETRLNEHAVSCSMQNSPDQGELVLLNLYFDHCPRPLKMAGYVYSSNPNTDDGRVIVQFQGMCHAVSDELSKFVFRRHRRVIASSRLDRPIRE
jgi:hypothetical protein